MFQLRRAHDPAHHRVRPCDKGVHYAGFIGQLPRAPQRIELQQPRLGLVPSGVVISRLEGLVVERQPCSTDTRHPILEVEYEWLREGARKMCLPCRRWTDEHIPAWMRDRNTLARLNSHLTLPSAYPCRTRKLE